MEPEKQIMLLQEARGVVKRRKKCYFIDGRKACMGRIHVSKTQKCKQSSRKMALVTLISV